MNIKPIVYENLTASQRVIAAMEALARNDDKEHERLLKTCPKKTYSMEDYEFTGKMNALHDLALAVECDLRGCAISMIGHLFVSYKKDNSIENAEEFLEDSLSQGQELISIKQAWLELCEEENIASETVESAFGHMKHYGVKLAEEILNRACLEADTDTVEEYKTTLREYLKKASA